MPDQDFATQVQSIVGPVLAGLGFTLDEVDSAVDEGGRLGAVLYYRRPDCRIQIYWSSREGEINCMIGAVDAPSVHGLYDHSNKWHYLNDFIPRPDIPLEELVRQLRAERANFETQEKWLHWIAGRIEQYFDVARAGVLNLAGGDGGRPPAP